jgi:hypothetical protein
MIWSTGKHNNNQMGDYIKQFVKEVVQKNVEALLP